MSPIKRQPQKRTKGKKKMKEEVKKYLLENEEVLKDVVYSINGWDGYFDNLDYQENDEEFFNTYFEGKPMEAVRASYYGYYKFMDDYVKINVYGNLESKQEYQVIEEMKDYIDEIVDHLIEEKENIDVYDDKLNTLLEK